jgi:hypothetical protein
MNRGNREEGDRGFFLPPTGDWEEGGPPKGQVKEWLSWEDGSCEEAISEWDEEGWEEKREWMEDCKRNRRGLRDKDVVCLRDAAAERRMRRGGMRCEQQGWPGKQSRERSI